MITLEYLGATVKTQCGRCHADVQPPQHIPVNLLPCHFVVTWVPPRAPHGGTWEVCPHCGQSIYPLFIVTEFTTAAPS